MARSLVEDRCHWGGMSGFQVCCLLVSCVWLYVNVCRLVNMKL